MSEDCTYFESCVFDQTSIVLKSFQLQITASVRERTPWAAVAAPTFPAASVCEPMLLFVTERDFRCSFVKCTSADTEKIRKLANFWYFLIRLSTF